MTHAPPAVRASIEEVGKDPHAVATNLFRRLFPERAWPPSADEPVAEKWEMIVQVLGNSMSRPVRPRFEVIQ